MKKLFVMLMIAGAMMAGNVSQISAKPNKKGKKAATTAVAPQPKAEAKPKSDFKPYKEIITSEAISAKSFVTLHMVKSKLYLELPKSIMGKEMLIAGRVSQISDNKDIIAGGMPSRPVLVTWGADKEKVFLYCPDSQQVCDANESIHSGLERNNIATIWKAFPIVAISPDSSSVVIEFGPFVLQDKAPFTPVVNNPLGALFGAKTTSRKPMMDAAGVEAIAAFEQNVNIKTRMTFEGFMARMTVSMLLLPEETMRPRYSNPAIGLFRTNKLRFAHDKDYLEQFSYINRWDIAPKPEDVEKHKNGELVEPAKPIVYYVDPAFPDCWRKWLKEGIEDWQMAFEKIGFKNAIVAKDYPDDPNFDPEDIRNTCLIYSASDVANAMGPSWVDPRSGEIIQASVYFYHNVLSLLHNWRFVQTAAADESVRGSEQFDMKIMGPLLRYLVVHEVGHTLGFMHNMRGSYAFPVDSLRSPSFTSQHGTTASIMDYARFNYVAQPGDGVTHFLTPRLGEYDYYMLEWAYKPIYEAATPEDEKPILQSWISAHDGDPIYMYGAQALFGAFDPASQSESLGDDAMKASEYGIRNLKTINSHLIEWLGVEGKSYENVYTMKAEIFNQFRRYMNHCQTYIGGYNRYYATVGDGKQSIYDIVPKEQQKQAMNFIYQQIMELPEWFAYTDVDKLTSPRNEQITSYQMQTLQRWLASGNLATLEAEYKLSDKNYSAQQFIDDVYALVWKPTLTGKTPSWNEQRMQFTYVQSMLNGIDKLAGASNAKTSALSDMMIDSDLWTYEMYELPSAEQIEEARAMVSAKSKISDVDAYTYSLYYGQTLKLKRMLQSRANVGGPVGDHYKYLLYEIDAALNR